MFNSFFFQLHWDLASLGSGLYFSTFVEVIPHAFLKEHLREF